MQSSAVYPGAHGAPPRRDAPIVALLNSEGDRRLLSLAMTLRGGPERRVEAWSLPDEAGSLRERLRATMLGLRGTSQANRALRYMVEASARGHHIPVRILSSTSSARDEQIDELRQLPADTLLVTGWARGGQPPADPSFSEVIRAHAGPLLFMMECPSQPFTSALFVSSGVSDEATTTLSALSASVERTYPCWTREATHMDALEELLDQTTSSDLVLVSNSASDLSELRPLLDRLRLAASISTVGILLTKHSSRDALLQWLNDNWA